jgi:hypothetical protein
VRLQSAQRANTSSQSGRKTHHTQLWHRHARIRCAGGLFVAVCVLPGTELAFETPVKYQTAFMLRADTGHTVAIFRQINKGAPHVHHDALEFPDGETVLLTQLYEGQKATVLTLPTQPKTAAEAESQQRVAYVG